MRSPSLLLTLLLVVGQILSLTSGSPLVSDVMLKRECTFIRCRFDGEPAPPVVGTWTPVPYQPSETATAASAPTPVKQQLGADSNVSTGPVLEPSPALPSIANAGVALASHGLGLGLVLTGLLAIMLSS